MALLNGNKDTGKDDFEDIGRILGLDRKTVGIGFFMEHQQYCIEDAPEVKGTMTYCNMVRLATKGHRFKAKVEHIHCPGAVKALGMLEPTEAAKSGAIYYAMGLYDTLEVAKEVQSQVTYMDTGTYGVLVKPIEDWTREPDVVLVIANPYQCMRILQGYAHYNGVPKKVKFVGNAGICSESTATPFKSQDLNISLLCSNSRYAAKWNDDEMGIGIPFSQYTQICDGIIKTMGACEPKGRKKSIVESYQGTHRYRIMKSMTRKTYFEK